MINKVVTVTSKGQITLPKVWRSKFSTSQFLLYENKGGLMLKPVEIDDIESLEDLDNEKGYEVFFNAKRDNNGKGIPAEKFLKILKELDGED